MIYDDADPEDIISATKNVYDDKSILFIYLLFKFK